jgi:predicted thioesterase
MHGEASVIVNETNTASKLGSGSLPVFGTPAMIALMERAAVNALRPHLDAGQDSVGVAVNVKHVAATPMGKQVRAEAQVSAVEGRKVTFTVRAFDAKEMVGEGVHERVLIDRDTFMWKVAAKAT